MSMFEILFGKVPPDRAPKLQHHVVLGALLALVARAEGGIVPAEAGKLRQVLRERGFADAGEQDEIIAAAERAVEERLDWEGFTREINQAFDYEARVELVHDLFRVARADDDLSGREYETIRKLSDLLWVSHADFIQAKLATK